MSENIEARLEALGLELPEPSKPGAIRAWRWVTALPYNVAVEVEGIFETR